MTLDDALTWRILPVVVLTSDAAAQPLADALVAGDLPVAEVAFRTPAALSALRALAARSDLLVGAGTVVNTMQADAAVQAGARFVVSPGLSARVVHRCQDLGVPVMPGIATATELMAALDLGVDLVKFFPPRRPAASPLSAPWPHHSRGYGSSRPAGSAPTNSWPTSPIRPSPPLEAVGWSPPN